MSIKEPVGPICGKCGATKVRIYRDYGMFRRPERDRCNKCVDHDHRGWMVPCILSKDAGDAWGYSSVPLDALEAFCALPEHDSSLPYWDKKKSCWSDQMR